MNSQVKSVSSTCVSASITGMVSNLQGKIWGGALAVFRPPPPNPRPNGTLRALRLELGQAELLGHVVPQHLDAHADAHLFGRDVDDVAVHPPPLVQLDDRQDVRDIVLEARMGW